MESSKLQKFADDNFKFDENGSKLSKRVENAVEKGEIAHYEQFLLFPQCFQKACFPLASKGVVWEWVKEFPNDESVTKQKPFQRVEMENIRKKKSIRSFTELKQTQSYGFSSEPNCLSNYKNICKVI